MGVSGELQSAGLGLDVAVLDADVDIDVVAEVVNEEVAVDVCVVNSHRKLSARLASTIALNAFISSLHFAGVG